MLNRRSLTLLAFALTLLLAPGLSLAKPAHTTPASGHHSVRKAGCGIDPNGCPTGGGAGSTTNSGGH